MTEPFDYRDPAGLDLELDLPSAPPLQAHQLGQFRASTEAHLARIDLIRGFNLAQAD